MKLIKVMNICMVFFLIVSTSLSLVTAKAILNKPSGWYAGDQITFAQDEEILEAEKETAGKIEPELRMPFRIILFISIFTLILLAILIFLLLKFRKIKLVWMGALIGVALYLILFLLGKVLNPFQPSHLIETSFLGRFLLYVRMILLIPAFMVGFFFWGCEYPTRTFPPCAIIAMIITMITYTLIGALIGLLIHKIRRRKK